MSPIEQYKTSLILASLQTVETTSFLANFVTKMTQEKFVELFYKAKISTEKTEQFLRSNIRIQGIDINKLFRHFMVPKSKEVL